jgi:soluble cytochrome b562
MVSIVKERTRGEMVYLYDSESVRGNQRYAFRAVRLDNPTDNTLESGPVTVYGDGRFIGEGLTDPIPPRSTALIPFALDRQVIVERKVDRRDQISGLVKLQRGVLSSEVQHVRDTELKLTNRMSRPVTVYVRHTVGGGWDLLEAPESERIGTARLFAVALEGGETDTLRIREATPMARTLDLHSEESLDLVEAYLTRSSEHAALAEKIKPLLALHRKMADHRAAIATLREQMADYRVRMDELHGQIVTLKAVKAGGELTRHLKAKLHEISERVQKATLAVVSHQQDLMLARVQFQDAIAELTLEPAAKKAKKVAGS